MNMRDHDTDPQTLEMIERDRENRYHFQRDRDMMRELDGLTDGMHCIINDTDDDDDDQFHDCIDFKHTKHKISCKNLKFDNNEFTRAEIFEMVQTGSLEPLFDFSRDCTAFETFVLGQTCFKMSKMSDVDFDDHARFDQFDHKLRDTSPVVAGVHSMSPVALMSISILKFCLTKRLKN